ncbi:MAG: hypothetical protein K2X01_04165 [Cyanobacteria bacterium]|nr:hypothetical protein [Cyanobacteriota bacterium]
MSSQVNNNVPTYWFTTNATDNNSRNRLVLINIGDGLSSDGSDGPFFGSNATNNNSQNDLLRVNISSDVLSSLLGFGSGNSYNSILGSNPMLGYNSGLGNQYGLGSSLGLGSGFGYNNIASNNIASGSYANPATFLGNSDQMLSQSLWKFPFGGGSAIPPTGPLMPQYPQFGGMPYGQPGIPQGIPRPYPGMNPLMLLGCLLQNIIGQCLPPQQNDCKDPNIKGSAGIFGDPQVGLFTPGIGDIPDALKGFETNLKDGQTLNILKDTDKGGINVDVVGTKVNNNGKFGVGKTITKIGNDTVEFRASGELVVNGVVKGNINNDGLIADIQLSNGAVVKTSQEIDGADGKKAERFVIQNGEYKITAAVRKPTGANAYLDLNFEETTNHSAENATGTKFTVPGLKNPVTGKPLEISLPQLLSLRKDSPLLQWLGYGSNA